MRTNSTKKNIIANNYKYEIKIVQKDIIANNYKYENK